MTVNSALMQEHLKHIHITRPYK